MKFVHAADLHLDSPLRGLERYDGAPVERIRSATRRAFEGLVSYCCGEQIPLLVLAGDLFDGDWKDYSTGLFFAAQMSRLRQADVRVVVVRGNHDAASQITKHLKLPDNVSVLSSSKPETVVLDDLGVAVHGQSFARRAVEEDLAKGYPEPVSGACNIGVLHTCASGREGHEPYAPCSVDTLRNKGYDYWALGHVHEREVLCQDPWIVFSGNLQGRHAKELGPKGASVVHVADGRIHDVEHRAFDVVRWLKCHVDIGAARNRDDVLELVQRALEQALSRAEGRLLVARLMLSGETTLHATLMDDPLHWESQVRALCTDLTEDGLWLERLEISTRPQLNYDELAQRTDAAGQLLRALRQIPDDDERLGQLRDAFADLRNKLPREVREGDDPLKLEEIELYAAITKDVEYLVMPRLLDGAEGE